MNKNFMRTIGVLGMVSMLTGCTAQIPQNITNTVFAKENFSPAKISNESECLSNNVDPLMIERAEFSDFSEEQKARLSDAAFELIGTISSGQQGENILISPYSIDMALGMTENGAGGDTLSQMEETVNGGISRGEMDSIMNRLTQELEASEDVTWNVGNSIWFKDDGKWRIKDKFLTEVVSYYNPELYKAPFNEQTKDDINSWVNNKTKGMIPEILQEIPADAVMYLINAIAFDGEWQVEYEDDDILENRTFVNADNSESEVTMLYSQENRYFTLGEGQGFIKPYKGGEFSFVGILPDEGVSPEEYLSKIAASDEDFSKAVREAQYTDVRVTIPEFSMDYSVKLHDIYMDMGMDVPFDEEKADFFDMLETTTGQPYEVWIGKILHKTHIELDRKGTRAAAVTLVEMDAKCTAAEMPEQYYVINLDRPFVYAIVENETGLPVFLGCQNTMN
ncbi:MAG: serpin family protein [Lachnospiraceae bacterium]|nr:serpin family protein [Lachnospiraceae bacterium]